MNDRTFDRKVRKVAHQVAESITSLPETWSPADVVAVWRDRKGSAQSLTYAYWDLDFQPYRFPDYLSWHPRLRATRNDPEQGPAMFAAITGSNHELH